MTISWPQEITTVPIEWEVAGPQSWAGHVAEMCLARDGIQTLDSPAHCLVTLLTTLSGILNKTEVQKFMGYRDLSVTLVLIS
jgi:hypothetical protein